MVGRGAWAFLMVGFAAFGLSACGGGDGDQVSSDEQARQVVRGRVIYNAPVSGAQVSVKDSAGRSWETISDANGDFVVAVALPDRITPPVMVRAAGRGLRWEYPSGSVAALGTLALDPKLVVAAVNREAGLPVSFELFAVATAIGGVDVTPATRLVVDLLTANRSPAAFAGLGRPDAQVALAFTPDALSAALAVVRSGLTQLGLPTSLIDAPTSPALVAVDLTSTYEKLVSGDVLGALGAFLTAQATNKAVYGCNGEAWGTMRDDGQRRPSCLSGPNYDASATVLPFVLLETDRSLDVETRAAELAGGASLGGGWKYQMSRMARSERIALISEKILTAVRFVDSTTNLAVTGAEAQAKWVNWSDTTWQNFSTRLCGTLTAKDLSDLSYSYLELKRDMQKLASSPFPRKDAAEGLFGASSDVRGFTRALNRVVPAFFKDGSNVDTCPLLKMVLPMLRRNVEDYTQPVPRLPLGTLLSEVHAAAPAYVAEIDSNNLPVCGQACIAFSSAFGTLVGTYDLGPAEVYISLLSKACPINPPSVCIGGSQAVANMLATLDAEAAKIPTAVAAGQTAESGALTMRAIAGSIATSVADEYEKHFEKYYSDGTAIFEAFEVQGYAVDAWYKADARVASVLVPDVTKIDFVINGFGLSYKGDFVVRREDVLIPGISVEGGPQPKRRLVPVRINPRMLSVVATCYVGDLACEGRLRRTRAVSNTETVPVSDATGLPLKTWETKTLAPLAVEEALPYYQVHTLSGILTLSDAVP